MKKLKWSVLAMLLVVLLGGCSKKEAVNVRVASLKGPTSMGIVGMMNDENAGNYTWNIYTQADEISTLLVKKEVDIALIPANLAAVLYQKTGGEIVAVDINTLGVLYIVENGETINSVGDLKGRTIYTTGKGQAPDISLKLLLKGNGIDESDVTIEYLSEAAGVVAKVKETPGSAGLIPQPFVTTATLADSNISVRIDVTREWGKITGNSPVTGVTVATKDFVKNHEDELKNFMRLHEKSASLWATDPEKAAKYTGAANIVPENVAMKAYKACNIVALNGKDLSDMLSSYLSVLYESNPQLVGGKLPDDDFYYSGILHEK